MMQEQQLSELLIITCTYRRPHRMHFLEETLKVFRQIPNMRWIVVEDDHAVDPQVKEFLGQCGIPYVYLNVYSRNFGNSQKSVGLSYIRDNHLQGIIYTADDDNRYDVRLFNEIRKTRKISVFPVGNLGPNGIERPIVQAGKIVGWDADWSSRKFPIDQAGYAINAKLLAPLKDPLWVYSQYGGETEFIEKIIQSPDELEILCNECRDCYVWHNDLRYLGFLGKIWKRSKILLRKHLNIHIRRF
ncbi:MAG: hypothetical protein HQL22_04840 [Candidatus Omnitrophica bacterium]|nr:hypothetical protein [Candidatus Omnitrophota bacterium]